MVPCVAPAAMLLSPVHITLKAVVKPNFSIGKNISVRAAAITATMASVLPYSEIA